MTIHFRGVSAMRSCSSNKILGDKKELPGHLKAAASNCAVSNPRPPEVPHKAFIVVTLHGILFGRGGALRAYVAP